MLHGQLKSGDVFYFVSSFGEIYRSSWVNNNLNYGRLYAGNIFKNIAEARAESLRKKGVLWYLMCNLI